LGEFWEDKKNTTPLAPTTIKGAKLRKNKM
jgi:hypothetical protein